MTTQPYMIQVDLKGKRCLVVGGGGIGLHKTAALLASEAKVTVVSTSFRESFDSMTLDARHERSFHDADIDGMFLVHAATNRPELNHHIARLCEQEGVWCCVADDASKGTFGTPALLDRGPVRIAVSTQGLSPSYGARLRRQFAEQIPEHVEEYLRFLGEIREKSKSSIDDLQLRMRFNAYLASEEGERLFESSDAEALEIMVAELLKNPDTIPEHFTPRWEG